MLKIRLLRTGRKHDPSFRLVAVDSRRSGRSGKCLESLGFYNSRAKTRQLKEEQIKYWLSKGAQVSDSAHNLLVSAKIIKGRKIDVSAKSKKQMAKEPKEEKGEVDKEPNPSIIKKE